MNSDGLLVEALLAVASWIEQLPVPTVAASAQLVRIDKAIAAYRSVAAELEQQRGVVVLPERILANRERSIDDAGWNACLDEVSRLNPPRKFRLGDPVRKTKGSQWSGRVVGFYSTEQTPDGYAVESFTEKGSVQIYPGSALEPCEEPGESREWRDMLESLQWQWRDADDHYHKPAGYYCPSCQARELDGHDAACELRALLAQQGKAVGDE